MKMLEGRERPGARARLFVGVALVISILMPVRGSFGQARHTGTVKGALLDAETKQPLLGATVLLAPEARGTTTDGQGAFVLEDVSVGTYTLRFSYIGYEARVETDVVVRSGRSTVVRAELAPAVIEADAVVVTAGYFADADRQPVSLASFGAEEVRRAPGAGGDVSRILGGLPALGRVDDMRNSLVVRGGSPIENSFFVDNVEIPNINHFPTQGSSGGPIGLLNVDFIDDVTFFAGGFGARYGDRLSSVMDITFREGNRDAVDVQLDLNFTGAGVIGEGPLGGGKGSWLVSARRSYLDVLINTVFEEEAGAALPVYSDYQAKLVFDVNPKHRITTLGILGRDVSTIAADDARDEEENDYGDWRSTTHTVGANWRYLWDGEGFSNTAVSHSRTRYRTSLFETRNGNALLDNRSVEQEARLRNVNHYRLGSAHQVEFGVEARLAHASYDNRYGASTDPLGQPTSAVHVDDGITDARLGGFVSYTWRPAGRLTLMPGLRFDRRTYTGGTSVSPRFSASYQLTAHTSINAAAGRYVQSLPLVFLAQQASHKALHAPVAYHVVVGVHQLLRADTRLTVEAYRKTYRHFPLDPTQPSLFIIDQLFYGGASSFLSHERLVATGAATTQGLEVMVQKKRARNLYGLVSGAYFRSRYRGYDGRWRDRVFDNRFLTTVEGGYKLNHKHEVSLRWIYAGGAPYTPFDEAASEALGRGVFDEGRVNESRLPDYHSLNLRYDRRFSFKQSTLVVYLDVWNLYGRRNIATYDWNEADNAPRAVAQWGTLPVFGLEFEF